MIKIIRTDSGNKDFINLVKQLDADLAVRNGNDHSFYSQFNKIDKIKYAVVAYEDDKPVGCGAIKEFNESTMEVKRMFTLPEHRGKGVAATVLKELELWAAELSFRKCILETSKNQQEGIRLYERAGYTIIKNYGQYENIENSICYEKKYS